MLKFLKKKSLVYIWSIFCVLIILIPIVTNCFLLYQTSKELDIKENNKQMYLMKNIASGFDKILNEVDMVLNDLKQREKVRRFMGLKGELEQIFESSRLVNDLEFTLANSNNIDEIFLFYPYQNYIISSKATYDAKIFFEKFFADENYSYEQWRKNVTKEKKRYISRHIVSSDFVNEESGFLVTNLVNEAEKNKAIVVCAFIKEKRFIEDIEDYDKGEEKFVAAINKNGEKVFSTIDISDEMVKKLNAFEESLLQHIQIDGESYGMSCIGSKGYPYRYFYCSKSAYNFIKLDSFINRAIYINIFCVILLIVLAVLFINWNKKEIINILNNLDMDSNTDGINEYMHIQLATKKLKSRQSKIENIVDKKNLMIASMTIGQYMKRATGSHSITEILKEHNVSFDKKRFMVFSVKIRNYGVLKEDENELMVFLIKNIMEDILLQTTIFPLWIDGVLIYIINFDLPENEIKKGICEVKDLIEKYLMIDITFCSSSVKKDFSSLPELYSESVTTLNNSMFFDLQGVLTYDEIINLDAENEKREGKLHEEIKQYVDENYMDSSLNVNSIGYHFGKTAIYLSSIFKNKYNIKLSSYISMLRIEKAKKLLQSDDLKIDDVAMKSGFANTRTFLYTFKEATGITPTEWRKSNT